MRKHTKKLKAQLVKEWQVSGERKSDFASRHGIRRSTFYQWTKHLKASGQQNKADGFESIPIDDPAPQLGVKPTAIIHYSSGTTLELYTPMDARHLRSLVK